MRSAMVGPTHHLIVLEWSRGDDERVLLRDRVAAWRRAERVDYNVPKLYSSYTWGRCQDGKSPSAVKALVRALMTSFESIGSRSPSAAKGARTSRSMSTPVHGDVPVVRRSYICLSLLHLTVQG